MIQWVLDALSDAKHVDNVIIIGLSPKTEITCKKPMHFISNQGRMLANIVAGVESGMRTILVLTGVTRREDIDRFPYQPTWVLESVAEVEL